MLPRLALCFSLLSFALLAPLPGKKGPKKSSIAPTAPQFNSLQTPLVSERIDNQITSILEVRDYDAFERYLKELTPIAILNLATSEENYNAAQANFETTTQSNSKLLASFKSKPPAKKSALAALKKELDIASAAFDASAVDVSKLSRKGDLITRFSTSDYRSAENELSVAESLRGFAEIGLEPASLEREASNFKYFGEPDREAIKAQAESKYTTAALRVNHAIARIDEMKASEYSWDQHLLKLAVAKEKSQARRMTRVGVQSKLESYQNAADLEIASTLSLFQTRDKSEDDVKKAKSAFESASAILMEAHASFRIAEEYAFNGQEILAVLRAGKAYTDYADVNGFTNVQELGRLSDDMLKAEAKMARRDASRFAAQAQKARGER